MVDKSLSALTFGGAGGARSLSERLRDRTTLRFMGNCKCGSCQLVPHRLLDEAIAVIAKMENAHVR